MTGTAGVVILDEFDDDSIVDLEGAKNSAELIKTILENGRQKLRPLFGIGEVSRNDNPLKVEQYLERTFKNTEKGETVFLYVVGHGVVPKDSKDKNLWLPTKKTIVKEGGEANWIKFRGNIASKLMRVGDFSRAVVFVDTCHSVEEDDSEETDAISQDASGVLSNSEAKKINLDALEDSVGNREIIYFTSSSIHQSSFEITPFEHERYSKLLAAYKEWKYAPGDAKRMTAFAHAIGMALFIGDTGAKGLEALKLDIDEADLASGVLKKMIYDEEGDVSLLNLKDAVQLILTKLETQQTPQLLPSDSDGLAANLAGVRTLNPAKKDLRRKLYSYIQSLQHATSGTQSELQDFAKKLQDNARSAFPTQAFEVPNEDDIRWEEKLFGYMELSEPEFLESFLIGKMERKIEEAVSKAKQETADEVRLSLESRNKRILQLEDDLEAEKEKNSTLEAAADKKKKELNGKVRFWRVAAQSLMSIVFAIFTFYMIWLLTSST